MLAPIILFVYNRLWHTRQTVEALQKNDLATESELYVFCDGPKEGASDEQREKVHEVQEYIQSITSFKKLHIKVQESNRGLANSVISGVTEVVEKYGKVIVVEDDIVTHPFFLRFMNDALEFYLNDKRIFCIGGMTDKIEIPVDYKKDVLVVPRVESWGWATWSDRWLSSNWDIAKYDVIKTHKKGDIARICRGGDDLWPMLQAQAEGKIDSWAVRWHYNMAMQGKLCLRPVSSLVKNIGLDGTGVHCGPSATGVAQSTPLYCKDYYDIKCEPSISENKIITRNQKFLYSIPKISFRKRLKRIIRRILCALNFVA